MGESETIAKSFVREVRLPFTLRLGPNLQHFNRFHSYFLLLDKVTQNVIFFTDVYLLT